MRKFFIWSVLIVNILNFCCTVSYSAGDEQKTQSERSYIADSLLPIPMNDNTAGKVIAMSSEEDEILWIEVKDELFLNQTSKIIVNPKKTSIISRGGSSSFKDIKVGDIVDVVFDQEKEERIAIFISILNE